LSYLASVSVKLFVLYLIMGVGMRHRRPMDAHPRARRVQPIPFFYVMGGSLVFVFLTWRRGLVSSPRVPLVLRR